MQSEDPNQLILNNIIQARNIFKTQYSPLIQDYQQTKTLLQLKLKSQNQKNLALFIKKSEKQGYQKKPQIKNAFDSMVQQSSTLNIFQGLIKTLTQKKQQTHIQTFAKYENNISKPNDQEVKTAQTSLVLSKQKNTLQMNLAQSTKMGTRKASSLRKLIKPKWHPPFKLYRVIVGHQGWVRGIAISPCNTFFASGSVDRTIKFWDLASGELKISLTGHINTVRAVQFSKHHPYLFSCGEDKSVKCWDLQMNKVIRTYHGHLSGVYCLKIHDGLGVLVTGGRDSTARVWDIRVRRQIHALVGHAHTVGSILTQQNQPHVVTGSYDSFVKLWDIGQGKCMKTLTNHKKSIRAMVQNPYEYTFATASSDNIKVWKSPQGQFLRNISGHNSIIDAMAVNQDGVLVSGGDDGTMRFWDWSSGYNYQQLLSQPQPGSIAAQNGIFSLTFERSGSRLLTGQCDKTIKMYKQDQTASEQTHPIKQFRMEFQRK